MLKVFTRSVASALLVAVLVFIVAIVLCAAVDPNALISPLTTATIISAIVLASMLLLGLPLHFALIKLNMNSPVPYAIAGVIGAVPWFFAFSGFDDVLLIILMSFGLLSSSSFWFAYYKIFKA